ncbi:hypothetical protein [Reichenbachiella versicolor]|uniref:hypothetical protein n=1 Tax=Reichenbachiella versicolor TaxID=1821036 RepID=UPI000D6E8F88|nr:hypothetical protein [Reichenbachiella versicolor]
MSKTGKIIEIEYKGVKIIHTDLSKLSSEDAIAVLEDTLIEIPKYGEKSVLSLLSVKHLEFSTSLMKVFNKVGVENKRYVLGTAVCGLSSMTRLLAKGVITASGRKADIFNTQEEALEWLYLVHKGEK